MSTAAAATATVAGVEVPTGHYVNGERVEWRREKPTEAPAARAAAVGRCTGRRVRGARRLGHRDPKSHPFWR